MKMQQAEVIAARLILSIVFLSAGMGKVSSRDAFAEGILEYQILPERQAKLLARLLPYTEIALAVLVFTGLILPIASILALVLLLTFTLAIVLNLARGRRFACHCFGSAAATIGPLMVIRNVLLIALATFLITRPFTPLAIPSLIAQWQKDLHLLTQTDTLVPILGIVLLSLIIVLLLNEAGTILPSTLLNALERDGRE